jgi:hypothetical protein
MEIHMEIQTIIQKNRAVLHRARELNARAGKQIFPVPTRAQLKEVLQTVLGGARCVREIGDMNALRLPELEPELVELVTGQNPDEIGLCGRTLKVEYREGRAPLVALNWEAAAAHAWRDLPDEGVRLPGGREVEVLVQFSFYWKDAFASMDIQNLKLRCASFANEKIWKEWPCDGRPAIPPPDPDDPASVVPEIIECQYGISVTDGAPLMAYGTAAERYISSPWFEAAWFRNREEAEAAREKAVAKLHKIRKEAEEQRQLEAAHIAAEGALDTLRKFQSMEECSKLEPRIQSRIQKRIFHYPPFALDDLQAWTLETEALAAEAEAALKVLADKKAEAENLRREREAFADRTGRKVKVVREAIKTAAPKPAPAKAPARPARGQVTVDHLKAKFNRR